MAGFSLKEWLDQNVIPVLNSPPPIRIHSFLQHKLSPDDDKPKSILVFALADNDADWAPALKRILETEGWYFDYLREPQIVAIDAKDSITIFGGDGTPFIGKNKMAMARLVHRCPDNIELILEIGRTFALIESTTQAVKDFFAQFPGISAVDLIGKYRPPFGST